MYVYLCIFIVCIYFLFLIYILCMFFIYTQNERFSAKVFWSTNWCLILMFGSLLLHESDQKFSTVEGANSWDRMINRSWCVCYKTGTLKHLMSPCDLGPNDFIGFTEVKVCVSHETWEYYVKEREFCIRSNPLSQRLVWQFISLSPLPRSLFPSNQFRRRWFPGIRRGNHQTPATQHLMICLSSMSEVDRFTPGWWNPLQLYKESFKNPLQGIEKKLGTLCQDLSFVHERNQLCFVSMETLDPIFFGGGEGGDEFIPAASHKVTLRFMKKEGPSRLFYGFFLGEDEIIRPSYVRDFFQ